MKKAKKKALEAVEDPLFAFRNQNEDTDGYGVRPEHFSNISTHENVSLYYENAGIATRYAAFFTDTLIRGVFWLIAALIAYFGFLRDYIIGEKEFDVSGDFAEKIAMIGLIVYMAIFFLRLIYHILFEIFMRGRTPGKAAMGITVVSVSGQAPTVSQIVVRNVMRFFHMIPGGELADGIVAVCSKRAQRSGDMVAGTMVIKVRKLTGFELPSAENENVDNNVADPSGTAGTLDGFFDEAAAISRAEKEEADFLAEMKERLRREVAAARRAETGEAYEEATPPANAALGSQSGPADDVPDSINDIVPPGGYLTLGETIRLKEYLAMRSSLSARFEYDEQYVRLLMKKSGAQIPEKLIKENNVKFLLDTYNYHAFLWNPVKGGGQNGSVN